MKTSVLASLLLGSLAVAAPVNKRDLVYKTEVVTETVVVYTTVWDDEVPNVAEATSTPGLFYEHPTKPANSHAEPTETPAYTPAYTPPAAETPSAVYTPPPSPPKPEPTSVYTPPPPPPSSAPAPAPVPSSAPAPAPQPSSPPTVSKPNGQSYHGDITIYDNTGADGACGQPITDEDMYVALAKPTWGESTYDVMTGASTNPWCGKSITVSYNGNTIQAKIMDMCPGCSGADIDLSLKAWKTLTGLDEKTRLQADWWTS